jgi:fatty acid desaturase
MSIPASRVYGCDQSSGGRMLTRHDLAPELRARVRALQRIESWRSARRLAAFILLGGAGVALILRAPGIVAHALGTGTVALALVGLSVLMHEGCHHSLFRSRRLSRVVGFCCGVPVLISVSAYRGLHLRHHAFERSERDPDDVEHLARRPAGLVLIYYGLLLAGTYLYFPHVALSGLKAAGSRGQRALILSEYAAILALLGAGWLLHPDAMVRAWLMPMVLAAQITNVRSLAEHGLTTGGNPFTATRSVVSSRFASFFFCNLNYHLEHHLFPAVPWYNLPELHQLLLPAYRAAGASVYRTYREFLADFIRVSWSGLIPDVRLLPVHLRDEFCA